MIRCLKLLLTVLALAAPALCQDAILVWGFECQGNKCVKVALNSEKNVQGLTVCTMLCGNDIGTLWPKPRGYVKKGTYTIQIDRSRISFRRPPNLNNAKLWRMVEIRFRGQIGNKVAEPSLLPNIGQPLVINISIEQAPANRREMPKLTYDTDESYSLKISQSGEQVLAEIKGKTFFGARHGLETLSQIIVYDEIKDSIQIIADTEITDSPAYKHRGVILDTARNYFSVKSIKRTIDGMAMSKLNRLHWHLTDATSFPLVVPSRPDLHNLGAYSANKIYTRADITDVLDHANSRGVRVIPEFDAPAHVGEGWQNTKFITCFNAQPWKDFCKQAPCGQLDPTNDALYDVLEDIYREIVEAFDPDVVHMGSDTVSYSCWNASESIRSWILDKGWKLNDDGFIRLLGYFQTKALATLDKVSKNKNISIVMHASQLADDPYIDEFLDKSRHIIQIFDSKVGGRSNRLIARGFRLLPSNSDLFVDDDTASWLGEWTDIGGWQRVYNSRPETVAGSPYRGNLGAEIAVYSEQIDEFSLDTLLWPKGSALGERLWTNPDHGWQKANSRLSMHRTHLTENGLKADALQPEWCFLNNNECPKFAYDI